MRLNSDAALALGAKVFREYGYSWENVYDACDRRDDGVLVLVRKPDGTPIDDNRDQS